MSDFLKRSTVFKAGASMLTLGAALLLSACATSTQSVSSDVTPEGRLFGDYLAGTYANYLDDAGARSYYFSRAFDDVPDNVGLGRRAVTSAVTNGDMELAERTARRIAELDEAEPMSEAVIGARALARGQYQKAFELFDGQTADLTVAIMMSLMKGWTEFGLKDYDAARESFKSLPGGSYFTRFGLLQTAELEAQIGNFDAADAALAELNASDARTLDLEATLLSARIMAGRGQAAEALSMLETYSKDNGTFEIGPIPHMIKALTDGQSIVRPLTPQQLSARALTQPAYGFFAQNRALDAAEVYLRIALDQDPDYNKGKLWLADVLSAYARNDEALAFYDGIDQGSAYYVNGQMSKGYMYLRDDKDDQALAVFKDVNTRFPSFVTRDALGRIYLSKEDYASALPIYEALVESLSEEDLKQDPQVLYFRGIAYEREDMWQKAVADFKRVLSYKPDDADALNYLGYTWVDRGENLTEAFDMIRRAVELEPESGAIVDSLGWAHYKLGQYDEALVNLEKAVVLSPSSATIIDHLGDVYWKKGRKTEARYQWERALSYDPTDKEIKNIKAKLSGGLSAVQAAP